MTPILIALAATGVLVAVLVCTAHERRNFPPISDAEFLARCTPGVRPEVALKVRAIVAEHFAVEYARIHPSTGFVEDLGAD